jgi:phosphatidylserine/phosphatidylglycerophosphate/cardiolipin synthase-like enzyme
MDCTSMIVTAIENAKKEVLVQAYAFTSCPIIEALAGAKTRGVSVRILLDKTNEQKRYAGYSAYLRGQGIEPKIDHISGGIAHKKTFVIDRRLLITGSLNPTWKGQHRNVEVVYFIVGKTVRKDESHWWQREAESRPMRTTPTDAKSRCGAAEPKERFARDH